MGESSEPLLDLARTYGVLTQYVDWRGETVEVSASTLEAVLTALGADLRDPAKAATEHDLDRWRRMLPPCVVTVAGEETTCWVHVPDGDPAALEVQLEDGAWRALDQVDHWVDPREVDEIMVGEATFAIPTDLPLGYHTLHARSGGSSDTATLIVTPAWVGLPPAAAEGRSWGFATQLYSVTSERSWGVGDFADLAALAHWSGGLGADYVLINPVHLAEPVPPLEPSPYLPSSRRFFSPLYLRIEEVPEYAALSADQRAEIADLAKAAPPPATADDRIDRNAAWTAKRAALAVLRSVPLSPDRATAYAAFCAREGEALIDVARWCVIAEDHGNDHRTWPDGLADARSEAVAAYAGEHADRIDRVMWEQWLVDEQMAAAQEISQASGMRLGVMHDLAVGVSQGGADAWRLPGTYAHGVTVGAPPDPYNQLGQNWGQPPWRPDRLAEQAYAPFRDMIRAVLRHAGGVRVDHIIGLFRLWWVPEGATADQGTYVHYDHAALIGVLALEAHRAGAVVVGEDLGVVPSESRSYLAARGILGTSILWFERDHDGPVTADRWREWCLASVTTHDLPPTAGYLAGDDIRLQDRLGLLPGGLEEEYAGAMAARAEWLRAAGVPDGAEPAEAVLALHQHLMASPSRMPCVALVDAVGDRRTQNQPGTVDEYPNWRMPLAGADGVPLRLEDLPGLDSARALAAVMREAVGQRSPR